MKHIELKTLKDDNGVIVLDYKNLLSEVLKQPLDRQRGADIAEMRASIRVLDVLEAADGTLELEDADYQHLRTKVQAMPWQIIDRRILQLVDEVLDAS